MDTSFNLEKELGLNTINLELKAEILSNAKRVIYGKVLVNVVQALSEGDKNELFVLLDQQDVDGDITGGDIVQFLREKIPTFDEMVQQEIQQFKEESIEFSKALR